jgi:trimethylamine--corrinoid protein Co-methyltransferase
MPDGEGITVIDRVTGEHRPSTYNDWLEATRLSDALDEIGVYWAMAEPGEATDYSTPDLISHWRILFSNFSKHIQDSSSTEEESRWLLEVLQAIFGDKETIRQKHPYSFLVCPQSPLIIEGKHTDAYLALAGWDIPIAVMPMPLMGGTGPGSMLSITILANCEVLSMLCLVQAAAPGTPFIYAPVQSIMNPRTGMLSSGAIENGLLGSAAIEMARYYELPVEGSGGGTDTHAPGIQATLERAMNAMLPMLSWPDLMVGAGLLGGSMILSLEQLVIDAEMFRMNKQAHRGIKANEDTWLDEVIRRVGPGGNFLGEKSTALSIRSGEWLMPGIGVHVPRKTWEASGKADVLVEARDKVENLLARHESLPLPPDVEKELDHIQKKASDFLDA